jgi:hypothetical protein
MVDKNKLYLYHLLHNKPITILRYEKIHTVTFANSGIKIVDIKHKLK